MRYIFLILYTVLLNLCISINAVASNAYISEKIDNLKYKTIDISIEALYTLIESGKNLYSVKNLFDNNSKTCWATKFSNDKKYFYDNNGNIEIPLKITFPKPVYLKQIFFKNGLQTTKDLFYANHRAKEIIMEIIFDGGSGYEDTKTLQLKDNFGEQAFDISKLKPWAVLFPIKEIWLKIKEIYSSNKYNDLCISDINLDYSTQILYKPSQSWINIKNKIDKNKIINKQTNTWSWNGLYESNSSYLEDLIYYVIKGNDEALTYMNSLVPIGTSHSEILDVEIKPRVKKIIGNKLK